MDVTLADSYSAVTFAKLPAKDALQKKVVEVAQEWADNNITTGTTRLTAAKLKGKLTLDKQSLKALSEKNFKREFSELSAGTKLKTVTAKFSSKHLESAVQALALSNAYSNEYEEGRDNFRKTLNSLLRKLGKRSSLLTLSSSTKVSYEGDASDKRLVQSIAFLNKETMVMLRIFVIEGTM